jgi:tetratricopeptide (TPR) repeat protein
MGIRFIAALFWFWHTRGYLHDAEKWITRYLSSPITVSESEKPILARACNGAGILFWDRNALIDAREYFKRSLELQRELNNTEAIAGCLSNLGSVVSQSGDFTEAIAFFKESLELFQETGNQMRQATVLVNLGVNADKLSQVEQAIAYYEQGLALQRPFGNTPGLAITLHNLAEKYVQQGRIKQAQPLFLESLQLHLAIDDRPGLANFLEKVPELLIQQGRSREAVAVLTAARIYRETHQIPSSTPEDNNALKIQLLTELGETEFSKQESFGRQWNINDILAILSGQGD